MPKVTGLDGLLRNIDRVKAFSKGQLDDIGIDALTPLVEETNSRAPRRSLQGGAVARRVPGGSRLSGVFWVAFLRGTAMRIAHLIEFGTAPHSLYPGASRRKGLFQDRPPFHPGTNPEPFFRPAFEATKEEVGLRYGRSMWNLILTTLGNGRQ